MGIETPTTLIIIGISGDLSKRKLLPAIRDIAKLDVMPDRFRILGVSRRELSVEDVMPLSGEQDYLKHEIELWTMDLGDLNDYQKLSQKLSELESDDGGSSQRLFYLAVPPSTSQGILDNMGQAGLARVPGTKLLLEKPFGSDEASAKTLISKVQKYFDEDQVYRIDHYLAKEMTGNIVVFRSCNALFKHTWSKDFIESIDITMTEQIGIEGRGTFYEQTGALRDIIQSHLLQLASLTLMELPEMDSLESIIPKRLAAVSKLSVDGSVGSAVSRGQYQSYRDEVGNSSSMVETFASVRLVSSDPIWEGVPITLTTGKALQQTSTEITIKYRRDDQGEANSLVLRIQPNEGVELKLWATEPGFERRLKEQNLSFLYRDHFDELPEAYQRVLVDAMRSDHSLFTSSQEVMESWRILAPIQKYWSESSGDDLVMYESRSSVSDILKKVEQVIKHEG